MRAKNENKRHLRHELRAGEGVGRGRGENAARLFDGGSSGESRLLLTLRAFPCF